MQSGRLQDLKFLQLMLFQDVDMLLAVLLLKPISEDSSRAQTPLELEKGVAINII